MKNIFLRSLLSTLAVLFFLLANNGFAGPSNSQLVVWSSEAVVSTYTFDYQNLVKQQKQIAKYFTVNGWVNYSKALDESKLLDTVQKKSYYVSSVPILPPVIKELRDNYWQATIYLLVLYKNQEYQQTQNLKVELEFVKTDTEGMNGFAIVSLRSTVTAPPCKCMRPKAVAAIV